LPTFLVTSFSNTVLGGASIEKDGFYGISIKIEAYPRILHLLQKSDSWLATVRSAQLRRQKQPTPGLGSRYHIISRNRPACFGSDPVLGYL
jgi:hypothetical protein